MAMKLLSKSEIDKAKAKDRQAEIAEGLKLAKRVDSLREVAAEEETALKKFREETLKAFADDSLKAAKKRDDLLEEVRILEQKRKDALVPLDAEWEEVKTKRKELDNKADVLAEWEEELKSKEKSLMNTAREIQDSELRIKTLLERASTQENEAYRKLVDANIMLASAQKEEQRVLLFSKETEEKNKQIAEWLQKRGHAVFLKEEELRTYEIDLAKRLSKIVDREKTLERNIKRLNK